MSDTPLCLPSQSGPGCGHAMGQHDANPARSCDCCVRAEFVARLADGLNRTQRRALSRSVRGSRG